MLFIKVLSNYPASNALLQSHTYSATMTLLSWMLHMLLLSTQDQIVSVPGYMAGAMNMAGQVKNTVA